MQSARVESINGEPRIAPIPTASPLCPLPKAIATIGRIVSGSAVPIAASTLPTAPSESPNPSPIHSTPFVKISAPSRITGSATTSSTTSTVPQSLAGPPCS